MIRLPEPTTREAEVLQLIADGYTNAQIGKVLYLSNETVKSHVRNMLTKTLARNRTHLVALGFRHGWVK